jgi:hypothetical protein
LFPAPIRGGCAGRTHHPNRPACRAFG